MQNRLQATGSADASRQALCSNRKAVTRAMTPVLSRLMTVTVANCLIFGRAGRAGLLAPERNFFASWLLV